MLLLCGGPRTDAWGQSREEEGYTFAFVGVPLSEALERVIDETAVSLVYASDLVAGKTAYCRASRVTADELLRCLLRDTGLDFQRLSSGTYILVPDPRAPPQYAGIVGEVVDANTGTPLADANVLLDGEETGTATNSDGRFAFPRLLPGSHRLTVTHVAYDVGTAAVHLEPHADGRVSLRLEPRVVYASPVIVSGFSARLPSEDLTSGTDPRDAVEAGGASGAADVVQSLDAIAGVRLGDALSDVHVQGGASDEQQFLLDGVPVYVPVPGGGFIGPFSPFAVGRITVQKAGFGASHGSGLSGVVEVQHQLATDASAPITAQVDPLSLNARWHGRTGAAERVEANWMVAYRHSLWDAHAPARLVSLFRQWATPDQFLYDALLQREGAPAHGPAPIAGSIGPLEVGFTDFHAAARVRIGGLRSVDVSFYRGTGAFGLDDSPESADTDVFEDAYRWRNRTLHVRHEWVQNRRLFLNTAAWATSYRLAHPVSLGNDGMDGATEEYNHIADVGLRVAADYAASPRHAFAGAVDVASTQSGFSLSLDPFGAGAAGPDDLRPTRLRISTFVEDRIRLGARTTLTAGSRLTYIPMMKKAFAEPRLELRFDHKTARHRVWAARAAVGLYRQFIYAFNVATYNATSLLPYVRYWLPIGAAQRPPEAYHATAGVLYRPDQSWQFTGELYYKYQPHLLVLDYGGRAGAVDSADLLRSADGYAYGLAVSTTYWSEWMQLGLQYEYQVAQRRIANRFGGAYMPVPWSAPHRLYLTIDVRPTRHWTAMVRWQGVFGRAWAFRQAYYDFLEPFPATREFGTFDLSRPETHHLPSFAQLDVELAYARVLLGLRVQGRVGFLNLLGHRNVTDWSLRYDPVGAAYFREARRSTPFLPTYALRLSY